MTVTEVQLRIAALQSRFGAAPVASGDRRFAALLDGVSGSTGVERYEAAPTAYDGASGDDVVESAKRYLGVPYVWGGESPDGFDCSGLVQHVFAEHGVELPRTSREQAAAGRAIPLDDLRSGDLVFFGRPVDHVGIYAGAGKMVVAPHSGDVVKVQDVDLSSVTAARRVLPDTSGASVGGWLAKLPAAARPYASAIRGAASAAGVDPKLVAAVAWAESGFRPAARSGAGAVGLMQLLPSTAQGLGVDPTDPADNLRGGARYLAAQLQRFRRVDLALAAYNAGPGAVSRAGGVPSNGETGPYVSRVLDLLSQLSQEEP